MAGIVNGTWSQFSVLPNENQVQFNSWVTIDGQSGPSGISGFNAEANRYHYYFSSGCPNCHRVAIALSLLGINEIFSSSYVNDVKRDKGWRIDSKNEPVFSAESLQAIMVAAEGQITSECSVPLLIDKKSKRIVSAQSDDMVKMMDTIRISNNREPSKLWPLEISNEIDELNDWIRTRVGSGVYDILFADTESAKLEANNKVAHALAYLDRLLSNNKYLFKNGVTASDIWLFPTLIRIDSIYTEIFGLSKKLSHYPNLCRYLRDLWKIEHFHTASDLGSIEKHYFYSLIHGPNGPTEPGRGKTPDQNKRFHFSN